MKKAFTLIELLAVLLILGVIALITFPIVNRSIKEAKEKSLERTIENIERAAQNYSILNNLGMNKNYNALQLSKLQEEGYLDKNDIINPVTNETMNGCVMYRWNNTYSQYQFVYSEGCEAPQLVEYTDNSGANVPELLDNMIPVRYSNGNWVYADIYEKWYDYEDKEWANAVVLKSDAATYNVDDVISMDDIALMYVWIPRYTYTIFNAPVLCSSVDGLDTEYNSKYSTCYTGETVDTYVGTNYTYTGTTEQLIDVKFETGTSSTGTVSCTDVDFITNPTSEESETCTDTTNGSITKNVSTYTHPAFTFDGKPITGFWVGKFEISGTTNSDGAIGNITIKPNVESLRSQTVSSFFTAIQNIGTTYALNGESHMMKNMEWGAVAYLKQSEYGLGTTDIGINNYRTTNSDGAYVYMTGCGAVAESAVSETCTAYNQGGEVASTTGNVYGVYDMSGGAYDYVMGNMVDASGAFYSSSAGFETTIDAKYYDAYANGSTTTTHLRGKLGDATKETLLTFGSISGGWNGDYASFPNGALSWFRRGGGSGLAGGAGVFNFSRLNGTACTYYSARAVVLGQGA